MGVNGPCEGAGGGDDDPPYCGEDRRSGGI